MQWLHKNSLHCDVKYMSTASDYLYYAFGLTWQMPLPCPELPPIDQTTASGVLPDVVVRYGELPPRSSELSEAGPLRQVAPGEARFGMPNIARLCMRAGNEIIVQRHPGAEDDMVRMLLTGPGAALLLHQRGTLPLHASGIVTPQGNAILFMGHSGSGKSTTLNGFLARGYPMLCEDLAAVRLDDHKQAWVHPGVQVTKLWADSAEKLGVETADLPRVRSELGKFLAPVDQHLTSEPAPVHTIYALSIHNEDRLELEVRKDVGKFNSLLDHTWQKLTIQRMGLHGIHFQNAVTIANQARIVRVTRPDRQFELDMFLDRLEEDFCTAQAPASHTPTSQTSATQEER